MKRRELKLDVGIKDESRVLVISKGQSCGMTEMRDDHLRRCLSAAKKNVVLIGTPTASPLFMTICEKHADKFVRRHLQPRFKKGRKQNDGS